MTASNETDRRGFCTRPGEGIPFPAAGGHALATGACTYGQLTVIHSDAPAGDHVPPHIHHRMDESFYVLAGHYCVTCGTDTFEAPAGSFVYLPAGVPHSYTVGESPARKLIIAVPGGLEGFFRDMGADVDIDTLQHTHGVTFL